MKKDIILAVVVAGLAFVGSTTGSVISSALDTSKWEKQMKYEQNIAVVHQRMHLIERTSIIFGKSPRIRVIADILKINADTANKLFVICTDEFKNNSTAETCKNIHESPENAAMFTEAVDLRAELSTALTMDMLYFCDKTRKSILEAAHISEVDISEESRAKILSAMVSETQCQLLKL